MRIELQPPHSERSDPHPRPCVVDSQGLRTLHFTPDCVQSCMRLDDPWALELAYTRTMMGFLLFVPLPRRISLIGLGGGSLLKFCHRHLPQARLQVAELNPHVLALREAFMWPPEDELLRLHLADGADFVRQAHAACEVLLLDGFDPQGMPEALCSQGFFDEAMLSLDDGGLMVINLHAADPRMALIMGRLARSFEGEQALLAVDDAGGGNRVVFAWRGREFGRCRPVALPGSCRSLAADLAPVLAAVRQARLGLSAAPRGLRPARRPRPA
jgi:spermidine synthase